MKQYDKTLSLAIGRAIAKARSAKKMTQKELSEIVGVSRPQIANVEKGRGFSLGAVFEAGCALGIIDRHTALEFLGAEETLMSCPYCLGDGEVLQIKSNEPIKCYACDGAGIVAK